MILPITRPVLALCLLTLSVAVAGQEESESERFRPIDLFELEYASDPQISPNGARVVYVRNAMDIMADRRRSTLWIVDADGTSHRPLTTGNVNHGSPRFSPDGTRLAYIAVDDDAAQLFVRWMDTGQSAKLTNLTEPPAGLSWSPDSRLIAFSMLVKSKPQNLVEVEGKPEGAEWADPPRVIRTLTYRADGAGYLENGYRHLFVVPADGGTPRQLTSGDFHHDGPLTWARDGRSIFFSANRREDWEYEPNDSTIYSVSLEDGAIRALTERYGPDEQPALSPDGAHVAYVGYDDRLQGYQVTRLYVMEADGGNLRLVTGGLDRDVQAPVFSHDGREVLFLYTDHGTTKIGAVRLDGTLRTLASDVGGVSLDRPYASGSFTAAAGGRLAFTLGRPDRPADVAVFEPRSGNVRRLTELNEDLLGTKRLGEIEHLELRSSFDGRPLEGWIIKPPDFDAKHRYPLILEIHGGPFADYGPRFAADFRLFAAAGYVVLYLNPRGSTSYGEEFGNLIHHNYPGQDYDDLMSGVDAVIARGYVDERNLFVTGGSGGGVLTAWIVGKTDRFRAAVVAKPVINWASFVLTADAYNFFYKYWFPGFPWDEPEHYQKRSPLSLVGNVKTPTMLLTGEADYRTPISESEQYYQALKLRHVDTALVRVPGASHDIAGRPSQMMAKATHVLAWFESHRVRDEGEAGGQ